MKKIKYICILRATRLIILLSVFCGCTTIPYEYGKQIDYKIGYEIPPGEPQYVQGRPIKVLDAADWYWPGSLLSKLLLWNSKVDSHQISDSTINALKHYMEKNELHHVKVRFNSYQVGNEWGRTFRNKSVGAPWRYTLGFLSWLQYTIMPGRFFGGDNYNPFSNTINIYSDIPAVALHEGGHSKDFEMRKYKGWYAFAYSYIPFFNLYPEAIATGEALGYLETEQDCSGKKDAYKILYPAYGSYIGGDIGSFLVFPYNYIPSTAGILGGHLFGRMNALHLHCPEEPAENKDVNIELRYDAPVPR